MSDGINRAISTDFMEKLKAASEKAGWWRDVLDDPNLIIALRGRSINVYWKGQALFNVSNQRASLKVTTHAKYLVDPDLADQIPLSADGGFDLNLLTSRAFVKRYDGAALGKMKRAASLFAGLEKIGCHHIAVRNDNVIDVEVAFPGKIVSTSGKVTTSPRVDLAALEPMDDEHVRLVFWEAKDFGNGELVAKGEDVPVLDQIAGYRGYVGADEHRARIEVCYQEVAANLVEIAAMDRKRRLSPLFEDLASGRKKLTLGPEPKVGLIIFGFDTAQRDHPVWRRHFDRLKAGVEVRAAGDSKNIRLWLPR